MGYYYESLPKLVPGILYGPGHICLGYRVHGAGGFVQYDQVGFLYQHLCKSRTMPLSLTQLVRIALQYLLYSRLFVTGGSQDNLCLEPGELVREAEPYCIR